MRHDRIDTVVESVDMRCMYEVHAEHDFTTAPRGIAVGSVESLLGPLGENA